MVESYRDIIKLYFEEHSFVESNIKSFNYFMEKEMQRIINEIGVVEPTIVPPDANEFKIKFGKVRIEKPSMVEADGSRRDIFPAEARLRQLTYSAPVYLEVSSLVDGSPKEVFEAHIAKVPVMLRSKYCHLDGLKYDGLIQKGEDPEDPGGYFILNGNEKVLIMVEDLAPNKIFIKEDQLSPSKFTARVFSERGPYRVPHTIEQMKEGIIYISFTRFKRVPIIAVIKALGLVKDQEIANFISDKVYDDIIINLYGCVDLKKEEDALEFLAKKAGLMQLKDERLERVRSDLDKYLLPHLGGTPKSRLIKAYNLCKIIKKFLMVVHEDVELNNKDHYSSKKLKLSGDMLADLFRVNMHVLVNDVLYNFQRLVKRGKSYSLRTIIREKLLTSRIKSAMATGVWTAGRKGISQNIDRTNFLSMSSHLQRVVSMLTATQENFDARALHCTHWGRLCPIETPEGTAIGLRKNIALLCSVTQEEFPEDKLKRLEALGLKPVKE